MKTTKRAEGGGRVEEFWAIVEVMGHARYAGRVSEYAGLGVPLVRVEIPAMGETPAFERLLGAAAIFRITPCTEEVARAAAERFGEKPLALVSFPPLPRRLPMDCKDEDDDDSES